MRVRACQVFGAGKYEQCVNVVGCEDVLDSAPMWSLGLLKTAQRAVPSDLSL